MPSIMDGLEHLLDNNVDSIIVDLSIGEEESIKFLQHIYNDYENKFTPVIIISNITDYDTISDKLLKFNIISIMSNKNWNYQVLRLLNYLRIQKLNMHSLQDSLLESEGRGTIDQLTGAYNRYGCEDIFHTLTSRFKAYKEPFCAVVLDIDNFKKINDAYGHNVGDEVLENFAHIIMSSIRANDSLIRLGGEEFLIFMSNVNINIVIRNTEKLRLKIEEAIHSSKNLNVTASFGIASYRENEDKESLIKRSDELLYVAKTSGKNIVMSENSKIA